MYIKNVFGGSFLLRDAPVDSEGGVPWNLCGAGIFFPEFLNKPMQRESDSGG